MKREIVLGFICVILIFTSLPSPLAGNRGYRPNELGILDGSELILDQKQEQNSYEDSLHNNILIAQSFTPSMSPLTTVEIKINKPRVIEMPIEVSIRKELNGTDITSLSIPAEQIPYFIFWVEFDFQDIEVNPEETYYIVVSTSSPSEQSYRWLYEYDETNDPYNRGKLWKSYDSGDTWIPTETEHDYIDATFRTYSYDSKPDLECDGTFNWTEVEPGGNVTGSFTVTNTGTPFSYLNWTVYNWPTWGIWSFMPFNSTGLKPEDGHVVVQVAVEAPHSNIPDEYTGGIKIINENNPDDYCTIDARLVTPKNKNTVSSQSFQFLKKTIQNFPFLQWLLKSYPPMQ